MYEKPTHIFPMLFYELLNYTMYSNIKPIFKKISLFLIYNMF